MKLPYAIAIGAIKQLTPTVLSKDSPVATFEAQVVWVLLQLLRESTEGTAGTCRDVCLYASEYINGRIIQKPMPQGKHSIIQGELVTAINAVVKKQRIAHAFPELQCTFGNKSIVPDVTVFS